MLHFRWVTFRANIYGPLDGEWLYYNFAAESFHTKYFVADFMRLKLHFIEKTHKNRFLGHSFIGRMYALHL